MFTHRNRSPLHEEHLSRTARNAAFIITHSSFKYTYTELVSGVEREVVLVELLEQPGVFFFVVFCLAPKPARFRDQNGILDIK